MVATRYVAPGSIRRSLLLTLALLAAGCPGDVPDPGAPIDARLAADARGAPADGARVFDAPWWPTFDAPPGSPDARPPDAPPGACSDYSTSQTACESHTACMWDDECSTGCYDRNAAGTVKLEDSCPGFCAAKNPTGVGECPVPCQWDDCFCGWKCMFPGTTCSDIC